jgi:hypothetical protein
LREGGYMQRPIPEKYRPELPGDLREALVLFNVMGGLDWSAVPVLFELYRIEDKETMINRLALLRDALTGD